MRVLDKENGYRGREDQDHPFMGMREEVVQVGRKRDGLCWHFNLGWVRDSEIFS